MTTETLTPAVAEIAEAIETITGNLAPEVLWERDDHVGCEYVHDGEITVTPTTALIGPLNGPKTEVPAARVSGKLSRWNGGRHAAIRQALEKANIRPC